MIAAAAAVVGLAMVYAVAVEPAWMTRARVAREMPQLQEQLAQVEALREEVRLLKAQGFGAQSVDALGVAAQQSLERVGMQAIVRTEGKRALVVSAKSVPAAPWFAWMEQFGREARVRLVHVRVASIDSPGMVEAEASFEVPAR
jgi:general secretion pathway protein M